MRHIYGVAVKYQLLCDKDSFQQMALPSIAITAEMSSVKFKVYLAF